MNDGRKKKPQKHKNRTAFKITFDTQALEHQKKVSLNNLCARCTQIMQWKLQYNKYKKMTQAGRCNICQQKSVYRTYMKACQPCVQKHEVCAKCLTPDYEQPQEVKVTQKDQKKQQRVEYNKQIDFMKTLQQRSRRTVRRGLQKGKISWNNELEYFVDQQGEKMIGLHFRKGFRVDQDEDGDVMDQGEDGDDMFGDDDDEDEDMFGDDDDQQQDDQQQKQQQQKATKKPTKQAQVQQPKKEIKSKKQQQNNNSSDIQGDEIDCDDINNQDDQQQANEREQEQHLQKQLDEMDIDDDVDFDDDQQQQQQEKKKKKSKKSKKSKRATSRE